MQCANICLCVPHVVSVYMWVRRYVPEGLWLMVCLLNLPIFAKHLWAFPDSQVQPWHQNVEHNFPRKAMLTFQVFCTNMAKSQLHTARSLQHLFWDLLPPQIVQACQKTSWNAGDCLEINCSCMVCTTILAGDLFQFSKGVWASHPLTQAPSRPIVGTPHRNPAMLHHNAWRDCTRQQSHLTPLAALALILALSRKTTQSKQSIQFGSRSVTHHTGASAETASRGHCLPYSAFHMLAHLEKQALVVLARHTSLPQPPIKLAKAIW